MQNNFTDEEFEDLLAGFEPAPPRAGLKRQIARRIESQGREAAVEESGTKVLGMPRLFWKSFTLVSAVAAAWAVLLVLGLLNEPLRISDGSVAQPLAQNTQEPSTFVVDSQPIEQYSTLIEALPSPVYYLENGKPVQRVALRYLDTEVWAIDDSDETISVSTTREEFRVIPAQTF